MKTIVYYSGKIETKGRECFVGNQKVDCPQTDKSFTTAGDKLDLLPQISSLERRSDPILFMILLVIIIFFLSRLYLKLKFLAKP